MFSSPEGQYFLNTLKQNFYPIPDDLNENQLLELLNQHRLSIWFFRTLSTKAPEFFERYPQLKTTLKDLFTQNTLRSLSKCAEQIAIHKNFQAQQINAIFLKGEPLSQQLYGCSNGRISGDIDILIDPKNLIKADECLHQLGYQRVNLKKWIFDQAKFFLLWDRKDIDYIHPQKKIMIELHWRFEIEKLFLNIPFKTLWESRNHVQIHGSTLPILGREHNALYLCLHGAKHGYLKFQWLIDIKNYLETQQVQLTDILETAKQYHVEKHCLLTMSLSNKYTNKNFDLSIISSKINRLCRVTENLFNMPQSKKKDYYFMFFFLPLSYRKPVFFLPVFLRACVSKAVRLLTLKSLLNND